MELATFALAHYAPVLLFGLLSYIAGARLTRQVNYAHGPERVAFCTALGLGVYAYFTLFLAAAGGLYPVAVAGAVLFLQLFCYREWIDLGRALVAWSGRLRKRAALLLLAIGAAVVFLLLYPGWQLPLYPPSAFDATMYHLAAAKTYVAHHQLVIDPYLRFPFFPQTNEMLAALMMLLYDDVAAEIVQFLMTLLVGLALIGWGTRAFSQRVGLAAGVLWLSNPLVLEVGSNGLIDAGLTLFVMLGTYALFNWVTTRDAHWLALSGAFVGLGAGSKYTGLFFMALFGIVACYFAVRRRRWYYPLLFGVVAVGVALPWYLRGAYFAHNPLEPFFPQVFGYHTWNEADMQGQLRDWALKGMGKDPGALLVLPWNLAMYQGRFGNDLPLLTVYFWLLPLTIYWAVRNRYIRGLMVLVGLFTLFWFYNAQIQRYLLPVVPPLILATVASVDLSAGRITYLLRPRIGAAVTAAAVAVCFLPGWLFALARVEHKGPIPVTAAQREQYLARVLPAYPAHEWLNNNAGNGERVYGLYDEDMAYYTDGTFMGNTFGPARFNDIVSRLDTGRGLFNALVHLQTKYLIVTEHRKSVDLPHDNFFVKHFRVVFQDRQSGVQIYEIVQ